MGARRFQLTALVTGLAAPVAVSAVLVPFRGDFADPAAALVLTAVVVAVAMFANRLAGLLAALSAGAWFDFFITKPYDRFSISSAHDLETTVALVIVGVAVTEIAVRGRRHYGTAKDEGNFLAAIRDLSELVATGAGREAVIATARLSLTEVLGLTDCRFEPAPPNSKRVRLSRTGGFERSGSPIHAHEGMLPAGELEVVAQSRNNVHGVFVLRVPSRHRLTIEQRVAALALADQVSAALAIPPAA